MIADRCCSRQPAFLPWYRMGNIRGWAGGDMNPSAEKARAPLSTPPLVLSPEADPPLPCGGQHWVTERGAFQKKLLARMRGLGMTAVLSSFSGHIPKAFADKHPEAKIRRSPNWGSQQRSS